MTRLIALFALAPTAALAHPGDHPAPGLLHLVTEPDHLGMIALGALGVGYTLYKLRSRP
jgi:hypothetical protein